jgi:uncharacterized protein YcfJ
MRIYTSLLFTGLIAGLVGLTAATANAGESGYYPGEIVDGQDYAIVTGVTPIYNEIQVREPRTRCWDEQVVYQQPPSPAGTIIGGLIGAAVGNKLGRNSHYGYYGRRHGRHHGYRRGDNRAVGTIAGAAIGATIGQGLSRRSGEVQYGTQQRCEVVDEFTTRSELVGYDVNYRYNGREFMTRTDRHPGDRIRVRVDVTPIR